ncbi:MAG: hypothetical protein Q9194_003166, partial [Teloschistes cf. exilis]
MDYLSFKFLKSGTDLNRASDEKLRASPPSSRSYASKRSYSQKPTPQSPSTGPTPSPSSIKTTGSSSLSTPSRPISHLRNTDPLPASFAALEGHLNHHASQLQQLADRVEAINDWIELDSIVLARLIRDEEKRVDDLIDAERRVAADAADHVKRAGTVRFELDQRPNGPNNRHLGPPPFLPPSMSMSMADKGKRSASMGDVPRTTSVPDEPSKEKTVSDRKKEAVNAHAGIQEVRERIRGMRRWRKEVERSVVWQREEFWRVEKGMGKKKGRQSVVAPAAQGKENKEGDAE